MALAQSKVTTQGQVSLPAEARRKLGIGPGSVLECEEEWDVVIVRKAGRYLSEVLTLRSLGKQPSLKGCERPLLTALFGPSVYLELVEFLFSDFELMCTKAVENELGRDNPTSRRLKALLADRSIKRAAPRSEKIKLYGDGERAAINLALGYSGLLRESVEL